MKIQHPYGSGETLLCFPESRSPRVPEPRPKQEPVDRFEYKIDFILKFKDVCRDTEYGQVVIGFRWGSSFPAISFCCNGWMQKEHKFVE